MTELEQNQSQEFFKPETEEDIDNTVVMVSAAGDEEYNSILKSGPEVIPEDIENENNCSIAAENVSP